MHKIAVVLLLGITSFACTPKAYQESEEVADNPHKDHHSAAKPFEVSLKHLHLNLFADFEKRTLIGSATWQLNEDVLSDTLFLDTDELNIEKVEVDGLVVDFKLEKPIEHLGSALKIPVNSQSKEVKIFYETSPQAKAIQWIEAEHTQGKKFPFMFTQSQAILARSWIPCQDSPGIRFTYTANIQVPKGMLALMSAENPTEKSADGKYGFVMNQAVPAYLMALSIADVEYKAISNRTGVYAESNLLEKAAWEFADMEKMLIASEALYGSYQWEKYDLIVLPPSFPFGGMENPRLTFCTPTIIAGDRSLTSLIAHEMAHSWSGNLVTNATWNDFWLNEGFTVYFERRIMEALYGRDYAEMLALLGYQDLEETVERLPANDTRLKLNLKGRNPDDGLTDIAYEKGYFFLRLLEESYGRAIFDNFVVNYFSHYAFKTINTETFIDYLDSNLFILDTLKKQNIQTNEWVYESGIPSNCPRVVSTRFQKVSSTLKAWADGAFSLDELSVDDWTSHEYLHFIRSLPDTLSTPRLKELDVHFNFSASTNAEIQAAWYTYALGKGYTEALPFADAFLMKVGRRKFLTPVYKALLKMDESGKTAKEIYQRARPNYHSVAKESLDKIVGF